jgi:hypothetical protein
MALTLRRKPDLSENFWLVHSYDRERCVGRMYRKTGADGRKEWFRGLGFPYTNNEPQPFYGTVAMLEEAKARFRESWKRRPR